MNRVLLLGLDGADPALCRRWMDDGVLPNLRALAAAGALLPLESVTPPATFPAWTTCVTGVNPGRHGVFDFTEMVPGRYAVRFVNGSFRRAPAVWDVLSRAGRRVVVAGVPATWPPEPVNGLMLSGFDSPVATSVDASFVYPRARAAEAAGWRFADFQEGHIGPGWHAEALRRLLRGIEAKERILLNWARTEPWDFFMAVFGESDTVSHHFWMFHDPQSPRYPGPNPFSDAIRDVYARLDAAVGRLVDAAGPDTLVMVVSDHGFTGAGTTVVHLNNRLAEMGLLRYLPGGGRDSLLKRLGLSVVPERARGALFRRLRGVAGGAESRSRFGGLDWANTRAYSEELGYFPSVRVNLRGRDPQGTVAPEDYDTFVAELCARLREWDVIADAVPRARLYNGAHVDRAPDVVLSLKAERGYAPVCVRARSGGAVRTLTEAEYPGGKERGMNGVHRNPGVLAVNRPVVAGGPERPSLLDIAPTVLSALGVTGPDMEGRPLFAPGPRTADTPPADGGDGNARPYSPEEEALLEERLRSLGYLE
ncbi:MAG TPA: alkaline phosphatase family protein [Candidatus Hydrogenedentes bacterium]|nr:alkaline phosphatase family protein [Candidatus Hydrogenedentota bacterium]